MVYIIAEAGVDHEGSLNRAYALAKTAKEAGADAFKTQYYEKGLRGQDRELPWLIPEEMITLEHYCTAIHIDFLCTPHDTWSLNWLMDNLNPDTIKIGSGGWHLIDEAQKFDKKLIISTGMHGIGEVISLSKYLDKNKDTLLHCVSSYPTPLEHSTLETIPYLRRNTQMQIGYSDHCAGQTAALCAIAMNASIVEKHLTLENCVPGRQDTFCSLVPEDFKLFVQAARAIEKSLDSIHFDLTEGEQETKNWIDERNQQEN